MGAEAIPGLALSEVMGMALQYLFAMLRIGAFLLAAPLFSARFVPLPIRILFTAVLAMPVFSIFPLPDTDTLTRLEAVGLVIRELAIGVACGLVLQIIFGAAAIAGDWIAATAGLGFAAQIDPTSGTQSPVISQFFNLFLIATFVSLDGHLLALSLMLDSMRILPPAEGMDTQAIIQVGLSAGSMMLDLAARLMMPIVAVLLVLNIVIGVMTRSAPQLNVFSFGFPLTIFATVLLLFVTAPTIAPVLGNTVDAAIMALRAVLEAAGDG